MQEISTIDEVYNIIVNNFMPWQGITRDQVKVQRLCGLTNMTYKVYLNENICILFKKSNLALNNTISKIRIGSRVYQLRIGEIYL